MLIINPALLTRPDEHQATFLPSRLERIGRLVNIQHVKIEETSVVRHVCPSLKLTPRQCLLLISRLALTPLRPLLPPYAQPLSSPPPVPPLNLPMICLPLVSFPTIAGATSVVLLSS